MRRHPKYVMAGGTVVLLLALTRYQALFRSRRNLVGLVDGRVVVGYGIALALVAYAMGFPDAVRDRSRPAVAIRAVLAAVIGAALGSLTLVFLSSLMISRFLVTAGALANVPWLIACGEWARRGEREDQADAAVAVGDHDELATMRSTLLAEPERPVRLVQTIATQDAASHPVVLREVAARTGATLIVLGRSAQAVPEILATASTLHAEGLRVRSTTLFYDEWLAKLPIAEIASLQLMFDVRQLHDVSYARVKRIVDAAVAVPGLLVCAAVAPFVAVGNLVSSRGPLFYRQTRVGYAGVPFTIWKFRSMRPAAARTPNGERATSGVVGAGEWTSANDDRITPFGRFLRRSHLDELPQAWNLLRGDLSLVGPRPEQPHYVEELTEKVPHYGFRHLVRPGLTGWAQVKYPYGASEGDSIEKLEYDLYYLRHQSLRLDAEIAFRTIRHVVHGDGR